MLLVEFSLIYIFGQFVSRNNILSNDLTLFETFCTACALNSKTSKNFKKCIHQWQGVLVLYHVNDYLRIL